MVIEVSQGGQVGRSGGVLMERKKGREISKSENVMQGLITL